MKSWGSPLLISMDLLRLSMEGNSYSTWSDIWLPENTDYMTSMKGWIKSESYRSSETKETAYQQTHRKHEERTKHLGTYSKQRQTGLNHRENRFPIKYMACWMRSCIFVFTDFTGRVATLIDVLSEIRTSFSLYSPNFYQSEYNSASRTIRFAILWEIIVVSLQCCHKQTFVT